MQAFLLAIAIPLLLLNLGSGLVGGAWLAFKGEWVLIGAGVLYMMAGALLVSVVLLPSMLFAGPAMALLARRQALLAALVGFPGVVWTYAVLGASCVLVFTYVLAREHQDGLIPYLLWGHAVALAPWAYLAQKDSQTGNDTASLPLFFAGVGVVSMMVGTLVRGAPLPPVDAALWFAPFLLLGLLLHTLQLIAEGFSQPRY